jgi:ferredoxin
MRVHVESDRCEGYGTCAAIVPELFLLDEWGYAYVAGDGEVPAARADAAREAVASCPMHAIMSDDAAE